MISGFPRMIKDKIGAFEAIRTGDWELSEEQFALATGGAVQHSQEIGCFFVDSVESPGEGYNNQSIDIFGENTGGFLRPSVPGARTALASRELVTVFRETNLDFVESVIRPWIIMASHYGYLAYADPNLRVRIPRIDVISFGRFRHAFSAPFSDGFRPVRKIYTYYNCAPVRIESKRHTYGDETFGELLRPVSWTYDNYSVKSYSP